MDEEEEAPIAVDAKIARKSLLPLQDPWYCSSPLFPVVSNDIGASDVPSQWNIRGEAPQSQNCMDAFSIQGYGFAPPAERASTLTSAILVSQRIDKWLVRLA